MTIDIIPEDESPVTLTAPERLSFAASMPETAAELDRDNEAYSEPVSDMPTDTEATSAMFEDTAQKEKKKEHRKKLSRKMKNTMAQFQAMFADGIGSYFTTQALATGHTEWGLDDKDKALIDDSIAFVMDALDIEIDIEPVNVKLESVWWVFLYPLAAFGIVFFRRQSTVKNKHPEQLV